jgi:hypothetical protein
VTPTRREERFLAVAGLLLLLITLIPQQTLNDHEYIYLIFVVLPLGLYLATDPARMK